MTRDQALQDIQTRFNVIGSIDLSNWNDDYVLSQEWLRNECKRLWRESFEPNDRIVVFYEQEIFVKDEPIGVILSNLQASLNETDITSSFVLLISTAKDIADRVTGLETINKDQSNQISFVTVDGDWNEKAIEAHPHPGPGIYQYGSVNPIRVNLRDLDQPKRFMLADSKTFCIYPWVHLHAYPTGEAWPCCHAEMRVGPVGDVKQQDLATVWNSDRMRELRRDMLADRPNSYCDRCYEQERSGFFSGRQSANKHHGHHIHKIDRTQSDGSLDEFEMTYWDIRFSNLCNLRCRSCGHTFSSSWYADQKQLAGSAWADKHPAFFYAGRTETDMWEQLLPHMDYVEQIYFAGGEPLMMDEHYRILEELERRGRFDVRLIYNTNFTQTRLKDRSVFDYWRKFSSVAVGASLDAMGPRAEYIRKGTDWAVVEHNRRQMLDICPDVDFYISPTLSIMNALHLPDFHKSWVDQGLLRPQDLNVNILQDPAYYRIDIAPPAYKERLRQRFEEHLDWLRPQDALQRATVGFESAITFMMSTDNSHLVDAFRTRTSQLDDLRHEKLLDVIPELEILYNENPPR